jgi:hypothetical protein
LLLPVKNNIGQKPLGRAYRIATKEIGNGITAAYVKWDDAPVDYSADQAIAANNAALKGGSALEDAKEFLRELLADGPVNAKEGDRAAKANGIAERTLYRARKDLGVTAKHDDSFEGVGNGRCDQQLWPANPANSAKPLAVWQPWTVAPPIRWQPCPRET